MRLAARGVIVLAALLTLALTGCGSSTSATGEHTTGDLAAQQDEPEFGDTPTADDTADDTADSPWGAPVGTGHVKVKTSEGFTADAELRWFAPTTIDVSANPDEDCVEGGSGSSPTWDPGEAWLGMHLEVTITNTTTDFDWPSGYGGVLWDGQMPGIENFCVYGDATSGSQPGTIWIGSEAMDGTISGITRWAESTKTPAHPDGQFDGVVNDWASWHWYFGDAVACTAEGVLSVKKEGTDCEFIADL